MAGGEQPEGLTKRTSSTKPTFSSKPSFRPKEDGCAETSPCSQASSAKGILPSSPRENTQQGLVFKAGKGGQPGPLLLSAHSLHRAGVPQPCIHASLPSPRTPYLPPRSWEQPDLILHRDRVPIWSSACSVQSTPGTGKPQHTQGNSEAPRRQPGCIYTPSMTAPLPLTLPTGWDFNGRFPPEAGGHAGSSTRSNIRSAHPRDTPAPSSQLSCSPRVLLQGQTLPAAAEDASTMLSRAPKACWDLQSSRYFPDNRFILGHLGLKPPKS